MVTAFAVGNRLRPQGADPHARHRGQQARQLSRKLLACGGGGQQSAALGLLGASVTVVDQDAGQLARDHRSWEAHHLPPGSLVTLRADIRDVAAIDLLGTPFALVWMPYSINFVPDCRPVIAALASKLAPEGVFRLQAANPFVLGMHPGDRAGDAYLRRGTYVDGDRVVVSYTLGDTDVLDSPGLARLPDGTPVFTRALKIGPSTVRRSLLVADIGPRTSTGPNTATRAARARTSVPPSSSGCST